MTDAYWEHFEHGADIGVRGVAPTLAGAFEQAAMALTATVTDPETVKAVETVAIDCEAPDDELLLTDWLNAVIYEMATRHMLFGAFRVTVADGRLSAAADGEPVDRARHHPAVEPKGATFTELAVLCDNGVCTAQCVVDV
jgi:tRNA nucleotidyltransferase (CCA-adding enzyme)